MILTYRGLQQEVLRQLDEAGNVNTPAPPTTLALVRDLLNQAHQQRCIEHPWRFLLWPHEETIVTTAGVTSYALHSEFHRPLWFYNRTAQTLMREAPLRTAVAGAGVWTGTAASVQRFTIGPPRPVLAHPSPPSTVTLVSDATLDVGAGMAIVVKGETATGGVVAEMIAPHGTTPSVGLTVFRTILAITRAGSSLGTYTLTDASGRVLTTLANCEMGRSYPTIDVEPGHAGGETLVYRFYRQPLTLINDYDIPDIPAPHAQILVYDTLVALGGYLTQMTPQALGIWQLKQREAQDALYQAHANEQQTLGADPVFAREPGDEV